MAARLSPAGVAEFVRGLRGHEEHATAWDAVTVALGRDVRQVADIIAIFAGDEPAFADAVLEAAVHAVEPAERIVLAALLRDALPPAVAAAVWARCSRDLDGATLVRAFDALRHRAEPSRLVQGLQEAVLALPVALVAELARQAHRWVDARGVQDVFRALVLGRPVADISELSGCLLDHSERDLAWLLLDLAVEAVPGRDGPGDAAELIIALARQDATDKRRARIGRRDPWRWRDRIPDVISGVAARCDPALIMGMIDRLVAERCFGDYAKAVRAAVTRSLDAGQLARLPSAGPARICPWCCRSSGRRWSTRTRCRRGPFPAWSRRCGRRAPATARSASCSSTSGRTPTWTAGPSPPPCARPAGTPTPRSSGWPGAGRRGRGQRPGGAFRSIRAWTPSRMAFTPNRNSARSS